MNNYIPHDYIFCYLDVMGYSELVKYYFKSKMIELLETSFEEVFYKFLDSMKNRATVKNHEMIEIFNRFKIYVISDSILIRMPLNGLKMLSHGEGDGFNKSFYVQMFCDYISFVFFMFPSKVGFFLRGGVSINQHYENTMNNKGLFMFSKALIDSYTLEKSAKVIRLLVHENILSYIEHNGGKDIKDTFIKDYIHIDSFGDSCLNYYKQFNIAELNFNRHLQNMKEVIESQIKRNKGKDKELGYYRYLVEYHNNYLTKMLNKNEYIVDFDSINYSN